MRVKAQWRIMIPGGRFSNDAHKKFFKTLGEAFQKSREMTRSETAVVQIQDSLENDIKSGARTHEHGNDVQTIARQRIEAMERNIRGELIEAEAEYVQAEIEALESLLKDRQARLQELQGVRGFVDTRTIELAKARERIARKAMVQKEAIG
jgi:uncharacterized membrane protein